MIQRIPWLSVHVTELADGVPGGVRIECRACYAQSAAPVGAGDEWLGRVTADLAHAEECPVPDALQKARAARWN